MKKFGLLFFVVFSINVSFSSDSTVVEVVDSIQIENVVSDTIFDIEEEKEKTLSEENAEKNAQWFMYGFLALGAFLVFWKFKYNK